VRWRAPLRPWIFKRGTVNRRWYYGLRVRNALSRRIKVGFGPMAGDEYTLGLRKWHTDPFVNVDQPLPIAVRRRHLLP